MLDYTKKQTNEGATEYKSTFDYSLDFFSKAGSLFLKKGSFYSNEEDILSLFQKSWMVNKEVTFKLLLWVRDIRGGAGNRSGFRKCLEWVALNDPQWVIENLDWIPEVGRWDDLRVLFNTPASQDAVFMWAKSISDGNILAAKWANRKDRPLKHILGFKKEGEFRKFLAEIRKNHIVEHKMSTKNYNEIRYEIVPSLAMARYTNAFQKNDPERFTEYKESLKSGKKSINTGAIFPHDCVRTALEGDKEIADQQFYNLPNFIEESNENIMPICDTSGSMNISVSGRIRAVEISQALALYCSYNRPINSPFYKKFIGFCNESTFVDWKNYEFSQAVNNRKIFDGAVGSTRVDKALVLILNSAKMFNISQELMPTALLIISDMQFHSSSRFENGVGSSMTEIESSMEKWKNAGYKIPKIIYWNVAGYAGSPATINSNNVALVSGFSPSVLKSIFSGEDLTPLSIMFKTIEKYNIKIPE